MAAKPKPPASLGKAGRALWRSILGDLEDGWDLDARELHLLERACRCEDEMRQLEGVVDADGPTATGSKGQPVIHPAILEGRQLKLAQLRLLAIIEMADPQKRRQSATPAQARARHAAETRWDLDRRRGAARRG